MDLIKGGLIQKLLSTSALRISIFIVLIILDSLLIYEIKQVLSSTGKA